MTAPAVSRLSAPLTRRRARMGQYAVWQSRDFIMNVAIISLLLFGMLGWLLYLNMDANETMMAARHMTMTTAMKLGMYHELLTMFAYVAPVIALSGIVSTDRSSGYTRFLFSKPVSPLRFYAQSAVVRFIGLLIVGGILQFAWSRVDPPGVTWKFFVDIAVNFIAIGGIVFLTSVLTRYDGLVAMVVLLASAVIWDKWEGVTGIKHWITYVVPPTTKLADVNMWNLGLNSMQSLVDMPFPTKWVVWNIGYGLACLVLGLVMLRRIPLTKA